MDRGESLTVFQKGNFIFLINFQDAQTTPSYVPYSLLSTSLCFLLGREIELPPVKTISISNYVGSFVISSKSSHFFYLFFFFFYEGIHVGCSVQKAVIHGLGALGLLFIECNNPQIASLHQIFLITFTCCSRLFQV